MPDLREDILCNIHRADATLGQVHHIGCAGIRESCLMHEKCKIHVGYVDKNPLVGLDRASTESVVYKWLAPADRMDADSHRALSQRIQQEHRDALRSWRESTSTR